MLDALSQPEIRIENLRQAVNFSFEKYCQTLGFISGLLGIPNSLDLKDAMDAIQEQLRVALDTSDNKKKFAGSLITKKIEIVEQILLHVLHDLLHIKDFEDGWLLAAFNNMKSYLQLMKVALDTPQTAHEHSLQKFLRIETLLNMDKLFKHLFRAVSILRLGEDNHTHQLEEFFPLVDGLSEQDKTLLKAINIGNTQHYLHKNSCAELQREYKNLLKQSCALLSTEQGFHVIGKNGQKISHQTLQEIEDRIISIVESSLDLLIKLVRPIAQELEKVNNDIEEEIQLSQQAIV